MYSLQLKRTQLVWYGVVQDTQTVYSLQLKRTQLVWYGVVQDTKRLCTACSSNLHSLCGMVLYRTLRDHVQLAAQADTACVVQDTKRPCTACSSNLHSLCGMVLYRTLRDCVQLAAQADTACVVWCCTGHSETVYSLQIKPTQLVWYGVVQDT